MVLSRMRRIRWWLLFPPGALLLSALVAYFGLLADLPDPARLSGGAAAIANTPAASILITDRHGRLLYEVIDPNSSKHVPLVLEQIPLACRQATVATEDSRFYSHPGFDPIAIARAAWQNLRGDRGFSGASTLTQQVARNLFLSADERGERTLRRKVREAWLAWRLEQRYSKDEILALYLNTTYYGHYAVGIEAAAQAYFGMHATELDLAQCALLAGLPQYPAGYNPIENPEAARARQATVLRLMVEQGYISAAQAQDARNERLAFASTPFPIAAPHFVMWVQSQLEALLPPEQIRRGGLRVVTTLDLDWQAAAEDAVSRRLAQLRPCATSPGAIPGVTCDPRADPTRRVENAALVALNPHTGEVLALVGSPNYFDPAISGAVNAALSPRQPGSAIKPLTYAAALDPVRAARDGRPVFTAATVIPDLRAVFLTAEGEPYVPNNYDRVYHGPVTLRAALANSYNIPAVKTLDAIGINALIEQANALGIPWQVSGGRSQGTGGRGQESGVRSQGSGVRDQESDVLDATFDTPDSTSRYGLSLTLGGGEVRLLDLTAAYAAFANGGRRVTPYAIERIETLAGKIVLDNSAKQPITTPGTATAHDPQSAIPNPQSLDPRVAFLITDILSDNNARLPAFGSGNVLELGRPAAVKTGTTTDWRDNWTVGYTPELVTGVWVGNADNAPMKDVSGISGAAPIWRDFMRAVLRDVPPGAFPVPDGLVQVEVCADSGLLPENGGWQIANSGRQMANSGWQMADSSGAATSHQPPAISHQPPAISHQPPAISHQPPAISHQPSAISHQPPAISHQPSAISHQPSAISHQPSAISHQPPAISHQPTIIPCPHRRLEWFIAGTEPTEVDRAHYRVIIDVRTGRPADASTPPQYLGQQIIWQLPPEYQAWARANGIPQLTDDQQEMAGGGWQLTDGARPARDLVGQDASGSPPIVRNLRLTSPDPYRTYRIAPGLPPGAQEVPITAFAVIPPAAGITLLVDGQPFATVFGPDYTAWWPLQPGRHTFQAVAARVDGGEERSEEVVVFVE